VSGILVLTAAELEARALARDLELPRLPSPRSAFGRDSLRVAAVGPRAGLLAVRWPALVRGLDRPLVVSAGVCGGLDPELAVGDLILPESVVGPDGTLANVTPSEHRRALEAAERLGLPARTGRLASAREVVGTPEAKGALRARTEALAVDMESAAILRQAQAAGRPALVIRAVSDGAGETLPGELIRALSPEGRLRPALALALGVARPTVVPRAWALHRATRHALRAVARLLAALAG
jgi:adenosylhomocysteine nucleosidase